MSSSSSQKQQTSQTDNRRVLGEGALSAENSTVNQYTSTFNQTLDADVANKAIDGARLSAGQALEFGGGVVDSALSFGKGVNAQAFDFAGGSLDGALGFGGKALTTVANANADALGFGSEALGFGKAALNSVTSAQGDAFAGALSAVDKAQARSSNAISDAFSGALGFLNSSAIRENNALDQTTTVLSNAYADAKGRGALTDKILIGVVIMAGVIAVMALKK